MRPDLMEVLVCPVCKGDIELTVSEQDSGSSEVVEGTLHCPRCRETYPISDGIPDLLPPDQRT